MLSDNLEISDRVFKLETKQSVITVKDHKPDFMNVTQTRLINPTKSHLGRVSKVKLEQKNRKKNRKEQKRTEKNRKEQKRTEKYRKEPKSDDYPN